jgi:hypothetical protein
MVSTVYVGPEEEGLALNQPFIDIGPSVQEMRMLPWNEVIRQNRFGADARGCVKGGSHSIYGLNVYTWESSALVDVANSLSDFWSEHANLRESLFALEIHPKGVTTGIPDDATAYPFRDTTAYS